MSWSVQILVPDDQDRRVETLAAKRAFDSHFRTAGFLRVPTDVGVEQFDI